MSILSTGQRQNIQLLENGITNAEVAVSFFGSVYIIPPNISLEKVVKKVCTVFEVAIFNSGLDFPMRSRRSGINVIQKIESLYANAKEIVRKGPIITRICFYIQTLFRRDLSKIELMFRAFQEQNYPKGFAPAEKMNLRGVPYLIASRSDILAT